uniref:GDSL esterase/lipase n=1 Tax=Oryza sativa subsp. japonica TaxID=39947 RepID=Q6L576_ORYSJ|nr:unknown protein [Oryza sativa Japonica Group]
MEMRRVAVLGLVWLAAAATVAMADPLPSYYNAIFSFGDSFSDTGNFVIINSGKLPNMPKFPPPYARCSNGRLVIDFLAEAFGLPLLPPSANKGTNFSQGANFAVMGATALDLKYFKDNNVWSIPPFNTSMNVQLQWFDEVKQTICSSPQECREFFSKALFVFGEFGGNDYSFAWKAEWSLEKVKTMVPSVVASMAGGIERLLDEGARHVVVPGNLPAGCIPITLTMYATEDRSEYDPRTGCLKKYNSVALYHNAMLRIALDQLQRRHPDSRIVYADYYTPYIQFARTPHLYEGRAEGVLRRRWAVQLQHERVVRAPRRDDVRGSRRSRQLGRHPPHRGALPLHRQHLDQGPLRPPSPRQRCPRRHGLLDYR